MPIQFTSLRTGTQLRQYVIQEALGAGGFGITYRVEHLTLRDKSFALKEYFPRDFAFREGNAVVPLPQSRDLYDFGYRRFLQEAEILARCTHPAIVDVVDYFEANGTAYAALSYVPGVALGSWLSQHPGPPSQEELDSILLPLLDAMELVHSKRLLHRDIAPDNIMVRPDTTPCLIDFGAARSDMGQKSDRTAAIVKAGYSPPEQYLGDVARQGPWTDIYAMGATVYRAIMGAPPPDSMRRLARSSNMEPIANGAPIAYRASFLSAIDAALELDTAARPQSIAVWRGMLFGSSTAPDRVEGNKAPRGRGTVGQIARTLDSAATEHATHVATETRADATQTRRGKTPSRADSRRPAHHQLAAGLVVVLLAGPAIYFLASGHFRQSTEPSKPAAGANQPLPDPPPAGGSVPEPAPPVRPPTSEPPAAQLTPPSSAPTSNEPLSRDCMTKTDPNDKLATCQELMRQIANSDLRGRYAAHVEIGRARRMRREFTIADAEYSEAIRLQPDAPEAYNQRGIVRSDMQRLADALSDFTRAIALKADFGEALNNRAWTLYRLDRPAEGLVDADKACRLLPEKAYALSTRAHIHEKLGDISSARTDYLESLRRDPNYRGSIDGLKRLDGR